APSNLDPARSTFFRVAAVKLACDRSQWLMSESQIVALWRCALRNDIPLIDEFLIQALAKFAPSKDVSVETISSNSLPRLAVWHCVSSKRTLRPRALLRSAARKSQLRKVTSVRDPPPSHAPLITEFTQWTRVMVDRPSRRP